MRGYRPERPAIGNIVESYEPDDLFVIGHTTSLELGVPLIKTKG